MSAPRRERISVLHAQLVVQPAPEEMERFASARLGELIMPIAPTADDRANGRRRYEVVVDGWRFEVTAESAAKAELRDRALRAAAEHSVTSDITLRAQIPGRVARLWVSEGEQVQAGQRLLAIEAMKMENEIRAPHAGTIMDIKVEAGARVEREDELLTVAP